MKNTKPVNLYKVIFMKKANKIILMLQPKQAL
ncbi:hypothetical protein DES51_102176 [Dielma fastidiosa]|uniref:Uncharacterized protein n=1 Tax=Dielma fastidiosa TaxID=1034346 RepID=A0A318LH87_9FIRM|nr:hypothetical protein DES51_102176 [Dielma fastidiosa]